MGCSIFIVENTQDIEYALSCVEMNQIPRIDKEGYEVCKKVTVMHENFISFHQCQIFVKNPMPLYPL